jgi:hypothetical protein
VSAKLGAYQIEMINLIKDGSVITWRHINLHGEFSFKKQSVNDSLFNMSKILSFQVNNLKAA